MGQDADGSGKCIVCSLASTSRCSSCRQVFYCSREHQKGHWKTHKPSCFPFKVESSPELGRYMVASKDLKTGDVILKESPIITGPKQFTEPVCLGCYKKVDGSYKCSKCDWPLCSASCESSSEHQPECVAGKEIGSPIIIEDYNETNHFYEVVTTLRCLTLKKRSPKKYAQMLNLESHCEERKDTDTFLENKKKVVDMLRNYFLISTFPEEDIDSSAENIHKMTGILDVNALDIPQPETEIQGLFPQFAMLEHSCISNTKHKFDDKRCVIVQAARDIKAGEHLSTMYTHVLWGTAARRDHLKHNKYFMCQCGRCSDPTELGTHFSALRCPKCTTDYLLPAAPLDELADWICQGCDNTITGDEITKINYANANEVEQALMEPTVEKLEQILDTKSAILHSNHYHLFAVKHTLLQLYGREANTDMDILAKKEKLCESVLDLCETLDPGNARLVPYTAVTLYELHLACISRARYIQENGATVSEIKPLVVKGMSNLKEAIRQLKYEEDFTPEGMLYHVASKNLNDLTAWAAPILGS